LSFALRRFAIRVFILVLFVLTQEFGRFDRIAPVHFGQYKQRLSSTSLQNVP
jgi:hypothetical protein